jgi:hypothetical protein
MPGCSGCRCRRAAGTAGCRTWSTSGFPGTGRALGRRRGGHQRAPSRLPAAGGLRYPRAAGALAAGSARRPVARRERVGLARRARVRGAEGVDAGHRLGGTTGWVAHGGRADGYSVFARTGPGRSTRTRRPAGTRADRTAARADTVRSVATDIAVRVCGYAAHLSPGAGRRLHEAHLWQLLEAADRAQLATRAPHFAGRLIAGSRQERVQQ